MLFLAYWKTAWVRMTSPCKSQKNRSIVVAFSHGGAKGTASPLAHVLETWVEDRETETEERRVLKSQPGLFPTKARLALLGLALCYQALHPHVSPLPSIHNLLGGLFHLLFIGSWKSRAQ
jgi:hypothetical protein